MNITYFIRVVQGILGMCVCCGLIYMGHHLSPRKVVVNAYEVLCIKAKQEKTAWWDYEKWDRYLISNGAVILARDSFNFKILSES
jgi:hypothetical protein